MVRSLTVAGVLLAQQQNSNKVYTWPVTHTHSDQSHRQNDKEVMLWTSVAFHLLSRPYSNVMQCKCNVFVVVAGR